MLKEKTVEQIMEIYSVKEMASELEEDAECAGFADYYDRVLSKVQNASDFDLVRLAESQGIDLSKYSVE